MADLALPIVYTYYGASPGRGKKKPKVKQYRGSSYEEVAANVTRWMTRKNRHVAVVAEVTDETYGELLLVATYWPGEKFQIAFEQDVTKPVCVTNFDN